MKPSTRKGTAWLLVILLVTAGLLTRFFLDGRSPDPGVASGTRSSDTTEASGKVGVALRLEPGLEGTGRKSLSAKDEVAEEKAVSIEDWLLVITQTEGSLAVLAESATQRHAELEDELEQAVAAVMAQRQNLTYVLGLLAGHPGGELGLTAPLRYGAIRAVYWWIVVTAGHGEEREPLTAVLTFLPEVHPDVIDELLLNLVEARADGRLILDASYLQLVLNLRSAFPEFESLYSRLFEVVGESMTPAERTEFFSLFLDDTNDPLLVGLTIKNLLDGADPTFGLLLAAQLVDDLQLPMDVRVAASRSVATSADVYAATGFLASHSDLLGNEPDLWFSLGYRKEAYPALESEYLSLAAKGADPNARRLLVSAMISAEAADLLAIARSDTDSKVIGQALMTASARDEQGESAGALMDFVETRYGVDPLVGGLRPIDAFSSASNLARQSRRNGNAVIEERAAKQLEAIAIDAKADPSVRRSAVKALTPYLTEQRLEELLAAINS